MVVLPDCKSALPGVEEEQHGLRSAFCLSQDTVQLNTYSYTQTIYIYINMYSPLGIHINIRTHVVQ